VADIKHLMLNLMAGIAEAPGRLADGFDKFALGFVEKRWTGPDPLTKKDARAIVGLFILTAFIAVAALDFAFSGQKQNQKLPAPMKKEAPKLERAPLKMEAPKAPSAPRKNRSPTMRKADIPKVEIAFRGGPSTVKWADVTKISANRKVAFLGKI